MERTLKAFGLGDPYLLYVGSLEPRKNLIRLLEAFALLGQDRRRTKLVIVGAPKWQTSPILRRVRELGIEQEVRFLGPVPDDELPSLYSAAQLLVLPSLYEGFGLPVLEAMACGAPVVASNVSAIPEVAGDAAILVDPFDTRSISRAIARVLEDRALAEQMRARGLAQASRFSWELNIRDTCQIYEKVLA
jgi:glycosyltransferase involved in cell wall biosynthesis